MDVSDPVAAPFLEAAERGELVVQTCSRCGAQQGLPRLVCAACGSRSVHWQAHDGSGRILASTTVHRGPQGFESEAPYTVALVELDGGARVLARAPTDRSAGLAVGSAVAVTWELAEGHPPRLTAQAPQPTGP